MSHLKYSKYTHFYLVPLRHTKTTGTTKIPWTCIQVISWALQQSAQQIYFPSSDAPLCKVFLSTSAMSLWAFSSKRIVTHSHSPAMCWLRKAWVRMAGGSDNISSQRYPVSQSGVIISWLMVKWCFLCQEHRENGCLVSTMFLQNSIDVMHDKITKELLEESESAEEWWLLHSVNTLRLSHA